MADGTLKSYGIKEGEKQISLIQKGFAGEACMCCVSCCVPDGAWVTMGTPDSVYKKGAVARAGAPASQSMAR